MSRARRADLLRSALDAQRRSQPSAVTGALEVAALTSRAALTDLAQRIGAKITAAQLETDATHVLVSLVDAQRLVDCVAAAAVHGYPRPALEQLGRDADRLPAARTTDPSTSRTARPRVPTLRNQLGRLLVAFAVYDRSPAGDVEDVAMTSEQAARYAGLPSGSEYAKRCSELLALGYLTVVRDEHGREVTRRGATGRPRLTFRLTDAGERLVDVLLAQQRDDVGAPTS